MKVNASNRFVVPSQTKRAVRTSRSGWNRAAYLARRREFTPSAATTSSTSPRPRPGSAPSSATSTPKRSSTPSSSARRWRIWRRRTRAMPLKPCPPEVMVVPRKCTSMSSQWANWPVIAA